MKGQFKMRARIRKDGLFWVGEVYGTWDRYIYMRYVGEWTGWNRVTSKCDTKWGARRELEKWKDKNCPDEFEL